MIPLGYAYLGFITLLIFVQAGMVAFFLALPGVLIYAVRSCFGSRRRHALRISTSLFLAAAALGAMYVFIFYEKAAFYGGWGAFLMQWNTMSEGAALAFFEHSALQMGAMILTHLAFHVAVSVMLVIWLAWRTVHGIVKLSSEPPASPA